MPLPDKKPMILKPSRTRRLTSAGGAADTEILRSCVSDLAPHWEEYRQARAAMDAAWEGVRAGVRLHGAVVRLLEAHQACSTAAHYWDVQAQVAAQIIADTPDRVLDVMPPLREVARQVGVDASEWVVGTVSEYDRRSDTGLLRGPLEREVGDVIAHQRGLVQDMAWLRGCALSV